MFARKMDTRALFDASIFKPTFQIKKALEKINQSIRAPGILPVPDTGEGRESDFSIAESRHTEIEKLFLPDAKTWLGSVLFY